MKMNPWHKGSRGASRVVLILAVTLIAGCSAAGSAAGGGTASTITLEQAQGTGTNDAFEIIQRLRPSWLRARGRLFQDETAGLPVIYVDELRYGDIGTLRQINVNVIARIDYIGAQDATTRFGTGHTGGVIMVTTRR